MSAGAPASGATGAGGELTGQLWGLVNGFVAYHAVRAADELGVFRALAQGPASAPELASRLGADPARLGALLGGNVAAQTLERVGATFLLSPLAAAHLVAGTPGYLGALLRHSPGPLENWGALAHTVQGAPPPREVGSEDPEFYAELVAATFPAQLAAARAARAGPLAGRLAPGTRVLDVGAGNGPWSVAVLEADPGARAVLNDLPAVLSGAADRIAAHGLSGRAEFMPGDYLAAPWPRAAFDLVVLGHVLRAEGPVRAGELLGRAVSALAPGGLVLVAEYVLDEDGRGPAQAQLLGTTMVANTAHGATFTAAEITSWCGRAGLVVEVVASPLPPTTVLLARTGGTT